MKCLESLEVLNDAVSPLVMWYQFVELFKMYCVEKFCYRLKLNWSNRFLNTIWLYETTLNPFNCFQIHLEFEIMLKFQILYIHTSLTCFTVNLVNEVIVNFFVLWQTLWIIVINTLYLLSGFYMRPKFVTLKNNKRISAPW